MCTGMRFNDAEGNMFFGRNLDWTFDYGERVLVVPRGFKPASPFGATAECSHALIGMGLAEQGQPMLFDAGNDAGLAVAGLNFPGYARYESAPQEGKTNVSAWEFPLWVCANFESVDQVVDALQTTAIVDEPIASQWPSACCIGSWRIARVRSWWSIPIRVCRSSIIRWMFWRTSPVTAGMQRTFATISTFPTRGAAKGPLVALSPRLARAPPSAGFPATTRPLRALSAPRT